MRVGSQDPGLLSNVRLRAAVELEALIATAADAERIIGRQLPSQMLRLGPRTQIITA